MTDSPANVQAKVGPNAVTQVAAALRAAGGDALARQVFDAAQLADALATPPEKMVDQGLAARLHDAVRLTMPAKDAAQIAADAGARTADYLLANRIPKPAQWAMKVLPARLSARILLKAMASNAWTYAGTGRVRTHAGDPCMLEIIDNPLAQPDCHWHVAVFGRLFRALVAKGAVVRHTSCCADGALACRFEISLIRKAPQ
ncbi:MAG: bacteriochlorophyll 4-vinyl reductase [Octadecabacter sp.]|nr:bacteriochlorophyll 4-vinyl reductase [Octadecabacter sp.]